MNDRIVILSNSGGIVVAGLVGAERIVVACDPARDKKP